MSKFVFLFVSAFLIYSVHCDSPFVPRRVYEFGVDKGEVSIIKNGAFAFLQKEALVLLQAPPCQYITYVKVVIDSTFEPNVYYDSSASTVTIDYGVLVPALGAKYTVYAKTMYNGQCINENPTV